MRKSLFIGAAAVAAIAIPALALDAPQTPKAPPTRAAVEARVKAMFDRLDTNRDGAVTRAEFDQANAQRKAEWQAKRSQMHAARFAKLDTDGNGQISRAEWDAAPARAEARQPGARKPGGGSFARHAHVHGGAGFGGAWFDRTDADKDGKVTLAEANAAALQRFDRRDANHDGTIAPDERRPGQSRPRS